MDPALHLIFGVGLPLLQPPAALAGCEVRSEARSPAGGAERRTLRFDAEGLL